MTAHAGLAPAPTPRPATMIDAATVYAHACERTDEPPALICSTNLWKGMTEGRCATESIVMPSSFVRLKHSDSRRASSAEVACKPDNAIGRSWRSPPRQLSVCQAAAAPHAGESGWARGGGRAGCGTK